MRCPLAEVLESEKRGALQWDCQEVLNDILDEVIVMEQKEKLSDILSVMTGSRSLFHYDDPVAMPGGTSFIAKSLLNGLPKEATTFFEENINLHEDHMSIAARTTGQSRCPG